MLMKYIVICRLFILEPMYNNKNSDSYHDSHSILYIY